MHTVLSLLLPAAVCIHGSWSISCQSINASPEVDMAESPRDIDFDCTLNYVLKRCVAQGTFIPGKVARAFYLVWDKKELDIYSKSNVQ